MAIDRGSDWVVDVHQQQAHTVDIVGETCDELIKEKFHGIEKPTIRNNH